MKDMKDVRVEMPSTGEEGSALRDDGDIRNTAEFAAAQRRAAQTVRKNYYLKGHHHGVCPPKQKSVRLLWQGADLQKLLKREG